MLACHPRSGSPCCGSSTARRVPLPQAWAAAARRKSQLRLNSTKHSTRTSPATSSASNFGSATPPSSLIHSYRFSQDGSRVHRARSSLQLGQQLTAELGGPPPPAGAATTATSCSPTSSTRLRVTACASLIRRVPLFICARKFWRFSFWSRTRSSTPKLRDPTCNVVLRMKRGRGEPRPSRARSASRRCGRPTLRRAWWPSVCTRCCRLPWPLDRTLCWSCATIWTSCWAA